MKAPILNIDGVPHKRCTGCGNQVPLNSFNINPKGRGGRRSKCKFCVTGKLAVKGHTEMLAKKGYVYFITDEDNTSVKIGFSVNDVQYRFKAIASQSPIPLVLRGYLIAEDANKVEKELHRKFMYSHTHAEWFSDVEAILTEAHTYNYYELNSRINISIFAVADNNEYTIPEGMKLCRHCDTFKPKDDIKRYRKSGVTGVMCSGCFEKYST